MVTITLQHNDTVKIGNTYVRLCRDGRGRTRLVCDGNEEYVFPERLWDEMRKRGYEPVAGTNYWTHKQHNGRWTMREVLG